MTQLTPVAKAKLDLAEMVKTLTSARTSLRNLIKRLRRAAETAEPVGTIDGDPCTAELFMAGALAGDIDEWLTPTIDTFRLGASGTANDVSDYLDEVSS